MKDTLETNLTEENVKSTETDSLAAVETSATAENADASAVYTTGKPTKEEIIDRLRSLVEAPVETIRGEVESLKQAYYKIRRSEIDEQKKAFIEQGGSAKDFVAQEDIQEALLKDLMNAYKEKRASFLAEEEKLKASNYEAKLQLIEQLKQLSERQDDFN